MIVLTLSKCPPGLKGDVTKWLMEINTGVYVGKLSARVRDLLWKRICEYCGSGEATMVFSAKNEQGFSLYLHNTTWKTVDYDGIFLLKRPLPNDNERTGQGKESEIKTKKASRYACGKYKNIQEKPVDITDAIVHEKKSLPLNFVAIDMETTGLKSDKDSIIELAAVRYRDGNPVGQYHSLVKCEKDVPENIVLLTGINNEMLNDFGQSIEKAIDGMLDFLKEDIIVGHYLSFDMLFLRKTCQHLNKTFKQYQIIDTVILAKALCTEPVENYKLATLVRKFRISENQKHRALPDAILAANLYLKLNEFL